MLCSCLHCQLLWVCPLGENRALHFTEIHPKQAELLGMLGIHELGRNGPSIYHHPKSSDHRALAPCCFAVATKNSSLAHLQQSSN